VSVTRRAFLETGLAGFAATSALQLGGTQEAIARAADALRRPSGSPDAVAREENYWRRVAANYSVSR
jgi:hypothetical protein